MRDENFKENDEQIIKEEYNHEKAFNDNRVTVKTEEQHQGPSYRYAGFWMRLWAFLLDMIVIWSIGAIIIFPVFRLTGISTSESFMFSPASIATAVVLYGYFILMTKYFQQTLGKMVFGLKVVDLRHAELSWKTILFREGIGKYIAFVFQPLTFIVFLVVAFTGKKQGVHDLFADTTVVHEK
ncbi:RDD family protein [Bacillus sp. THAF10]|uniref:RDD family protein n=1 Tax=Bacillus sp. THAF10 TaxID=2587848 RepID=UPI001268AC51|nr:RDD family protein [Bacillus sp. THAF10]QFT90189.1 RDD family protein [Bacillus sp. THAF10]